MKITMELSHEQIWILLNWRNTIIQAKEICSDIFSYTDNDIDLGIADLCDRSLDDLGTVLAYIHQEIKNELSKS